MHAWKQDRIRSAERGENPMVLARMRSGFAVIGDTQFLPGYCLLLASPQVDHLTDLSFPQHGVYLQDMTLIGEAIMQVCQPLRINYEILGNYDHYLHAHIFPRYEWEPRERREYPVWLYPDSASADPNVSYSEAQRGELRQQLMVLCEMHSRLSSRIYTNGAQQSARCEQFFRLVDDPKTETVFASKMRHSAQE